MKHYLIYKTTNLIDNKIYIGCHITDDIDDDYLGSGKYFKYAINKYGIENFKKEILLECSSKEEMFKKESEIVNEEFVSRNDNYNLKLGGFGGFTKESSIKGGKVSGNNRVKFKEGIFAEGFDHRIKSEEFIKYFSEVVQPKGTLAAQSDSAKKSRIDTMRKNEHQKGEKNSQFGTMWITDGIDSKKVKKGDLIPDGWRNGQTRRRRK